MKQTYFGITANTDNFPPNVNLRDLTAHLFLSPNFSIEQVERIISDPSNVKFETLFKVTREKISELIEMQNDGVPDLTSMLSNRIVQWSKKFGVVTEDDIEYLQTKFHLKKEIFLEKIRMCLCDIISSPKELCEYICRFIKGQDDTVRSLSIPFYNHLLRVRNKQKPPKSAVCLIGGTGVGKTETIKRFAEISKAPIIRVNLGEVVPNGIVGTTIAKQISFYVKNEDDIEKYRFAILHFSELDKLTKTHHNSLDYGIEIQRELLGFFDKDGKINLNKNKDRWEESTIKFPVNDLLICFDGAFLGIDKIIEKRLKQLNIINRDFHPDYEYLMRFRSDEDIIEYGIMPELLARIGKISVMNRLSKKTIFNILDNGEEGALEIHKQYCESRGFNLKFTQEAFEKISELAYKEKNGARSIEKILNEMMEDVYFDSTGIGDTLMVDSRFIEQRLFHMKYGKLLTDYYEGLDVSSIAFRYGFSETEIYDIIITDVQYKKGG